MEVNQYLNEYYSTHDENARLLSKHGQVEFLTTMRYIEKYAKSGMRILEIGAGTGRYSHALARAGYTVNAVELIEHNIDVFREHTLPGESVSIMQGNALNLSGFGDEQYDITLLLGPIYHLYAVEEQKQALREALRVTKKGGLLFAAYCISDLTIYSLPLRRKTSTRCLRRGLSIRIHSRPSRRRRNFSSFIAKRISTR